MVDEEKVVDVEVKDAPNEHLGNENFEVSQERWSKYETFAIISFVLGISSLEASFFCWTYMVGILTSVTAIALAIPGLIFAIITKKDGRLRMRKLKDASFIINLIALILSAIALILSIVITILIMEGIIKDIVGGLNSALTSSDSTVETLLNLF